MAVDRIRWLAVVLSTVGCAADFSAAVHVTIDGPELTTSGGYWIEMRNPDGSSIDGLSRQYVSFAPGAQDVAVVLETDVLFGRNDSSVVRLVVDAVSQKDAPALARGARLLEVDRDEVTEVELALTADPRPLSSNLAASFDGATTILTVDPAGSPEVDGFLLDLWLDAGAHTWLGRLDAPIDLDLGAHRGDIAANGMALVVTAEPADSPEQLVASSGWPVLRGELHPALVAALVTAPDAEEGILPAMRSLLDIAEEHIGYALQDNERDPQNLAGVEMHCEHVFATLGGADVAENNGMRGDFDDSGSIMYVHQDHTGIGLNTQEAPGYLGPLFTALSNLESSFDVSDAYACAGNITAANVAALDLVEQLASDPGDNALAIAAHDAVHAVRGASWVDGGSASADQTTRCVVAELEELADLELAPTAAGSN